MSQTKDQRITQRGIKTDGFPNGKFCEFWKLGILLFFFVFPLQKPQQNTEFTESSSVSASSKPTTEFAQPRLSRVKRRSSPARGYKFGCVYSYMAGIVQVWGYKFGCVWSGSFRPHFALLKRGCANSGGFGARWQSRLKRFTKFYCRDQSGKMFSGMNFWYITDFIAG